MSTRAKSMRFLVIPADVINGESTDGQYADTCTGTATVTVVEGASPEIAGTAVCEFAGLGAALGAVTAEIDSYIISDPILSGTFYSTTLGESVEWDGEFDSNGVLISSGVGTFPVSS